MEFSSKLLQSAVDEVAQLPGIGRRTALRLVLHLMRQPESQTLHLTEALQKMRQNINFCKNCHNISDSDLCEICSNSNRNQDVICVVEDIADQWSIENSNIYKGYFHILGGTISSAGQRKEDLLINSLVERVSRENIEEVILATSATVEGQTTAYYIEDSLKKTSTKVTKLAQGLPVGGEIESLDDGTLYSAFKNRTGIKTNSD